VSATVLADLLWSSLSETDRRSLGRRRVQDLASQAQALAIKEGVELEDDETRRRLVLRQLWHTPERIKVLASMAEKHVPGRRSAKMMAARAALGVLDLSWQQPAEVRLNTESQGDKRVRSLLVRRLKGEDPKGERRWLKGTDTLDRWAHKGMDSTDEADDTHPAVHMMAMMLSMLAMHRVLRAEGGAAYLVDLAQSLFAGRRKEKSTPRDSQNKADLRRNLRIWLRLCMAFGTTIRRHVDRATPDAPEAAAWWRVFWGTPRLREDLVRAHHASPLVFDTALAAGGGWRDLKIRQNCRDAVSRAFTASPLRRGFLLFFKSGKSLKTVGRQLPAGALDAIPEATSMSKDNAVCAFFLHHMPPFAQALSDVGGDRATPRHP
jgi:hypothetical protein